MNKIFCSVPLIFFTLMASFTWLLDIYISVEKGSKYKKKCWKFSIKERSIFSTRPWCWIFSTFFCVPFHYLGGRIKQRGRPRDSNKILTLITPRRRAWSWHGAGVDMKNKRQDKPNNSRLFILNVEILLRLIADQYQCSVSGHNLDISM